MKRTLALLLLMVLLAQALPFEALAAIGKVMTDEELAAAYALTGYGDSAQSNGYHSGMLPNASWSASQLTSYLDDKLQLDLHNITDTLARTSSTLAENESAYEEFKQLGLMQQAQDDYLNAQELTQEMSRLKQQIDENGEMIARMSSLITEEGSAMFPSDQVRYSAKVETAVQELKSLRTYIVKNAPQWEENIELMHSQIQFGPLGGEESDGYVGDAISELFSGSSQPVTNSAKVTTTGAGLSRSSRLAGAAGMAPNDADTSVTVISKNQVCISLLAGDAKTRHGVEGVPVKVKDALNGDAIEDVYTTNADGLVVLPVNQFTADMYDVIHIRLEVDPRDKGYRNFMVEDLDLELGEIYTVALQPLQDSAAENPAANASGTPYIVSACMGGKDIMLSNYEMIYSTVNDYEVDIRVEVADADGQPDLIMTWVEETSTKGELKPCKTAATTHVGNVYTFRGPWRQRFSPNAAKDQRPTFCFGEGDDAVRYTSRLISLRSATDKPINEGTGADGGVFSKVLGKGLGLSVDIPLGGDHKIHLGLDLPFNKYLPKFSVNPAGYALMYFGSDVFSDKVKELGANWQNESMKDFKRDQNQVEKESGFANYAAQYNLAREYYREKRWKVLGESTLKFGVFAVVTGRWELDNRDVDVKTKLATFIGGVGFTISYNHSWTFSYPLGAALIPINITFTLGVSAGFGFNVLEVNLSWVNGEFKNWQVKCGRELTINIGLSFSARFGLGIKGFLEGWVLFTAGLNFMIRLFSDARSTGMALTYSMSLTVGVTVFFFEASYTWQFLHGTIWSNTAGNSLLAHYMNADVDDSQAQEAAHDDPVDYPQLEQEPYNLFSKVNIRPPVKVTQVGDETFAFYIDDAVNFEGKSRKSVCWVNLNDKTKRGKIQDVLNTDEILGVRNIKDGVQARSDYSFGTYVVDGFVYLIALCAKDFDENGYPVRNNVTASTFDVNTFYYVMMLESDGQGGLTHRLSVTDKKYGYNYFCDSGVARVRDNGTGEYRWSYDSMTNPVINYAQIKWSDEANRVVEQFNVYGVMAQIAYEEDASPNGATSFVYKEGVMLFFTDKNTKCGKGDGYDRVEVYNTQMGQDLNNIKWTEGADGVDLSFIALSRPKDGAEGDSVVELYDYMMGYHTFTDNRRTVVLEEGQIDHIQVISNRVDDGVASTVFYAMSEQSGDGASQYRLHGIAVEPIVRQDNGDATFEVTTTRYTYDMVLPTNNFKVTYIGEVPYLYWVDTVQKKDDPYYDYWRIWAVAYDAVSNSFTDAAVFAQFKFSHRDRHTPESADDPGVSVHLTATNVIQDVFLTDTGTGYLTIVPGEMSEKSRKYCDTYVEVSKFKEEFTPAATMKMAVPQEMAVAAGNILDVCLGVMNEGNVPIATYDLAIYDVSDGQAGDTPVETAHINSVDPKKSTLTFNGSVIMSGADVARRQEDFDMGARRQDWVLAHDRTRYNVVKNYKGIEVVSTEKLEDESKYIKTGLLMPGSTGAYVTAVKIPESWADPAGAPVKKNLRFVLTGLSIRSNQPGLQTNAAGAGDDLIRYVLDPDTGKLVLQQPLQANGPAARAIATGLYANEVQGTSLDLEVAIHDLDVSHRVYEGWDGQDWVDIVIHDHATNGRDQKLSCAVYVDGADTPRYVNLPYYESALVSNRTHTISLPVSALVEDAESHSSARVQILASGTEERAYANNEFTLYLGGGSALSFTKQPQDVSALQGETVTFGVEVEGGTKPYAYQWQVWDKTHDRWVDLPGYTDPTITREHIEKKWDGARFRCVVTDAQGTQIVSREATLTLRKSVDTGDATNLPLYLALALAALLLLALLRRRQRNLQRNMK